MRWTSDRFLKNFSVNIKIIHLTSKSLIFVLCSGSGYLQFAHWIIQCLFAYKKSSAQRISYFSKTKCIFSDMIGTRFDFSKMAQLTLKLFI